MEKNKRAVVLFSGGMDSTAAALWALKQNYEKVMLLSFRFGDEQRQYGELLASANVAKLLQLEHTIIDIKIPFSAYPLTNQPFCQHGTMKDPGVALSQHGVLPFNVALHLIYGASFGAMQGCEDIIWGSIKDEAEISSDFTNEYSELVTKVLQASGSVIKKMKILTPMVSYHKWEIAEFYKGKEQLLNTTWSCKNSVNSIQCGICYGCEGRRIALAIAGIIEETEYKEMSFNHPFMNISSQDISDGKIDLKELSKYVRGSGKGVVQPNI